MDSQEQNLRSEYEELKRRLEDPTIYSSKEYPKLARRQAALEEILGLFDDLTRIKKAEASAQQLSDEGGELSELAAEELEELRIQKLAAEQALAEALTPKDPNDERDAVVEIRGAAGGDEAALFAGDLFRMYSR